MKKDLSLHHIKVSLMSTTKSSHISHTTLYIFYIIFTQFSSTYDMINSFGFLLSPENPNLRAMIWFGTIHNTKLNVKTFNSFFFLPTFIPPNPFTIKMFYLASTLYATPYANVGEISMHAIFKLQLRLLLVEKVHFLGFVHVEM